MIETIIATLTKNNLGFFGGLWRSKKFSLVAIWSTICAIAASEYAARGALTAAMVAIGCGTLVISVYVITQSIVEKQGVKILGLAAMEDGETETTSTASPGGVSTAAPSA